ncbi:GlxA family transcriptional regulator [Rhizobium sp. RAF56]|jgi:transcriptional regulator GlxA family with amidase domain|uniref:GlxA family transcriptional regulator n=1 Tax=Rhizobium sp. RAF56 TaxID=3233062 RepID=UPI003F943A50
MRRIEILAFDNAQLLDVTGPLQVFATANDMMRNAAKALPYEIAAVSARGEVVTTSGLVLVTAILPEATEVDTLVIAGGRGVNEACKDDGLMNWIRRRAAISRRTASVCSGAFLLASAGLLDGKRAVTHWRRCAEFLERFPRVRLEADPIFVRDGTMWTSAGVTAGIDLALALVEDDLGRDVALEIARELVVFLKRPGGQSQFSAALALQAGGERFDSLHGWIMENLRGDLSLPALAERAHMSARSFSRHYRAATGRTPARAIEDIRVEAARRLLEQGASVSQTRLRCGFGSDETMRRSFLRSLGTTPQAYREHF